MRKFRFAGLRFVAFGIAALVVCGFVTAGLWNALMPAIFGLPTIGFWQALGMLVLSRLLFGQFGGRRRGRARFPGGIERLTPEERERFRSAMERRCAGGLNDLTPDERKRFLSAIMGRCCLSFDNSEPEPRA
jgi:hypothetical protein